MNQRQQLKLKDYLRYFLDNTSPNLPGSIEIDSGISGKHIVLVGALGGGELPAAVSMIKLHKLLKNNPGTLLNGKVTMILGNPQAFKQGDEYLHDPLNRAFKTETSNSYEGKRAATIKTYLAETKPDLVLDFHTSEIGEMRMITYPKEIMAQIKIMENISDISYYAAFKAEFLPGRLVSYCAEQSIPSFSIEAGNSKSKKSIGIIFDHMVRTLELFSMVKPKLIPQMMQHRIVETMQLFDIREVIKPVFGFRFTSQTVKTGLPVKKGEVYATYDGGHLVAHEDCYLFLPNKNAHYKDFDAGYLCKIYKFKNDSLKVEKDEVTKDEKDLVDDTDQDLD
jgi:succinylglutamate desuccinylase